jgi:hypothetical protein
MAARTSRLASRATAAVRVRAALLALAAVALAGPCPASAQRAAAIPTRVARLPAPAVTLAPHRGGVAALLRDGRLLHVAKEGTRTLARGLDGEVLRACHGRLLAIDAASGRLARVGGRLGPPVSLHATPLCLPDGGVLAVDPVGGRLLRLDAELRVRASAALPLLPDAEPVALADGTVAVPTGPTLRYRHGVLGDEVESASLVVVDPATLATVARWSAPGAAVIEQRRLAPFPAAGPRGLVATVSGDGDGGALAVLAAAAAAGRLRAVASAPGLGRERRWRHVLGARGARLYAVATPHLGGPLERFTLRPGPEGPRLAREAFPLDVTSHRIGRRELDLGRLLPRAAGDPAGRDLLLLPGRDLATLRLVACDAAGCRVAAEAPLPAPLAAAPWPERTAAGGVHVWAADVAGGLTRLRFPRDRIPSVSE